MKKQIKIMGLNNKVILAALVLILIMPMISAAPPFLTQLGTATEGYQVETPQFEAVKVNETFYLHAHVFNATNGVLIPPTAASCIVHLYNSVGTHIYQAGLTADDNGIDFTREIDAGNFSDIGKHWFIIQCNSSVAGGFIGKSYYVTESGYLLDEAEGGLFGSYLWVLVVITFIFFYFGFKMLENNSTFFIGLALILFGTLMIIYLLLSVNTLLLDFILVRSYSNLNLTLFKAATWILFIIIFLSLVGLFVKTIKEIRERKSVLKYGDYSNEKDNKLLS